MKAPFPKRLGGRTKPVIIVLCLTLCAGLTVFHGGCWFSYRNVRVHSSQAGANVPFSENDFLHMQYFFQDKVGAIDLEDVTRTDSERRRIVWDRFHTDLWRLETEILRARLKSLNADLVSIPEDAKARVAPPACTRNDSSWTRDHTNPAGGGKGRRKERRKIYDVFLFLDERPLIDIRLNELADVVDTFVIMQCPITFMNHSKPMPDPTTFPELAHVKHKMKRLYCDLENYPFQEPSPWKREEHMRYTAIKLVTEFVGPEDIVMLGDLDELVDGGAVDHLTHEPDSAFPITLYVPLYRSSFGCIDRNFNGEPRLWPGTVATLGRLLKEKAPGHRDGNEMRDVLRDQNVNRLWCAGWHCSSCMHEPEIKTKLSEYSHAAEVDDNHKIAAVLRDVRDTCLFGFYERKRTLEGLPKYVVKNAEKFRYLMPK